MKTLKFFALSLLSVSLILNAHKPSKDDGIDVSPASDPLLANVGTCFVAPSFPGNLKVKGQFNTYISPILTVNPKNKKEIAILSLADTFQDVGKIYGSTAGYVVVSFSHDGGKTWHSSIPAKPECLGGDLSQFDSGIDLQFGKDGILYFFGIFNDNQPFRKENTNTAVFVQRSEDGGKNWSEATLIDVTNSGAFNNPTNTDGLTGGFGYLPDRVGSILPDPKKKNVVHASWSRALFSTFLYGNIWYARSTNGGKSFGDVSMIYDLGNDSRWINENANFQTVQQNGACPADSANCTACALGPVPACIGAIGGQSIGGTLVSVPGKEEDCEILLDGFIRLYPKNKQDCYTQLPSDSFVDHAVVASYDGGNTWTRDAFPVTKYIFAFSHDPRLASGTFNIIISDGALNTLMAVSPKTHRVYMAWQGGDATCNGDNGCTGQFFPRIELSASADKGKTWSDATVVSRTSKKITTCNDGRNQAFNAHIAFLDDGLLGVLYTDFRNANTSPAASKVRADVWLALYKETKHVNVNAGLEFVHEIHVAEFDAAPGYDSATLNLLKGPGGNIGLAAGKDDEALTAFAIGVQNNPSNIFPCSASTNCSGLTEDVNRRFQVNFKKVNLKHHSK
jgi:hypothetical protein